MEQAKTKKSCMKSMLLVAGLALGALSPYAANGGDPAKEVVVKPVLSTSVTSSGQPIALPAKDPTVIVSVYEIAEGASLPEHKHIYPRYGYVMTGEICITNTETGKSAAFKAGDFIVEAIDQWHRAKNIGNEPVKLLVIDQVEQADKNVVMREHSGDAQQTPASHECP